MGERGLVLLAGLGLLMAIGACQRSPLKPAPADSQRHSNLGVSPATWPQEGPSPIVGQADPVDFAHNDVTGAVHKLVVDPANTAILYAGSANGGVWKTTNATAALQATPTRPHWVTASDALPSLSTGALAMDPLDSQHLIAGTGARSNGLPPGAEGLIYVTTNGGGSWSTVDVPQLRNKRIRSIVLRGQTVLACATDVNDDRHGFLFRSPNGGTSWSDLSGTGNLPASMGSVWDVVRDPSNTDRYYVVAGDRGFGGSGVYLGTSAGTSWTRISDSDTTPSGIAAVLKLADTNARLAVGPTGALYVLVASIGQPVYIGYTLNQGGSWTQMDMPVAATDPGTANNISRITRGNVAGGQPTTILVDAGTVEHKLTGTTRVRLLGLAPITDVNDLNGDWIARPYDEPTDGGTTTPSKTKFVLFNRLTNADGDGGTAAFDVSNQGTWQFWVGPNGGGQAGNNLALAIDPTDPRYVYVGGDASPIHLVRGDANQTASTSIPSAQWTRLTAEGAADSFFPHADIRDMILDPSGQFLYMSEDGGVFVRTSPRDASGVWASLAGDLMSVELRSVALDPLSHAVIGGAQDNGTPSEFEPSNGSPQHWQEIEFADGVAVAAVDGHATDPGSGKAISYRYTSFQGSNDFELHTFDIDGAKLSTEFLIDPHPNATSKLIVVGSDADGGAPKHLNEVENFDWLSAIGVNRVYNPMANPQPNPQKWFLIAGHNKGVWESRDLGETTALVPGSPLNARSFSYGNVNNVEALWVAAENGCCGTASTTIHSRLAAGETLTQEATFTSSGNGATAVAMAANDPTIAYATVDSRVYQLAHGDPVAHDVSGDLSYLTNGPFSGVGRLRSIVYAPSASNGDRIFVAASDGGVPGVFMMMVDNPGVWTRVGINLPSSNAMALDYDAVNSMLVVGMGGRGAWSLTNATSLDRAPKALCKNLTLSAGATCTATTTPAAFNNGSSDPDGNPLTITAVDPITLAPITLAPFGLGTFNLAIKFADNQGAAALCKPTLTVVDSTPPVLTAPSAKSVTTCSDTVSVAIGQATASDNCGGNLVPTGQVISRNGVTLNPPIPVTNGTASLSPGTYVVRWTASDGVNTVTANQTVTVGTGLEVSQSFLLDDRAQLRSATGGFAGVLNSGTGTTRVGQDCRTAGVVSVGPVTIQHRAIVAGNVVSAGAVTKDSDATVNGTITQNASVQLPALPTLPTFPPANLAAFTVNAGTSQTKGPGSYAGGTVLNGGTLILQAGDYFFQSLTINSGAIIRIPSTGRVFVRNTLVFNSPFLATSGSTVQPITLGFAGTTLNMFAVFNGTLIAPSATVVFGTGAGLTFTGTFFGRTFEVTPGSALVCKL